MTPTTYKSDEDLKNNLPIADAYCTGSDQVWNSHWNEGVDSPLYLSFVPDNAYRFSYSASIGNTMLKTDEKNAVTPLLKKYKHITVRENAGVDVIKDLGLTAEQVLDPTLLFTADEWQQYTSNKFKNKKYVVTYNLHHDKRIDQYAKQLAEKNGLKVYNISYNFHDIIRSGNLKWCPTIEEYLGLIRDAKYVVTDSFHATVFSVLFHTKLIVIYPEQASSRIRSILTLLKMENRGYDDMPSTEIADNPTDFALADSILANERKKSEKYIAMIKSEIENKIEK